MKLRLVEWLRRQLGLAAGLAAVAGASAEGIEVLGQLIDGQRRDFDQLTTNVLAVKDAEVAGLERAQDGLQQSLDSHLGIIKQLAEQLNRTTTLAVDLQDRLRTYERNVPAIAKVHQAIQARRQREAKRAEKNEPATPAKEAEYVPIDAPRAEDPAAADRFDRLSLVGAEENSDAG